MILKLLLRMVEPIPAAASLSECPSADEADALTTHTLVNQL